MTMIESKPVEQNVIMRPDVFGPVAAVAAVLTVELLALVARLAPPPADLLFRVVLFHCILVVPFMLMAAIFRLIGTVLGGRGTALGGTALGFAAMVLFSGERGLDVRIAAIGLPVLVVLTGYLFRHSPVCPGNFFPYIAGGVVSSLLAKGSLIRQGNWTNLVWAVIVLLLIRGSEYPARHVRLRPSGIIPVIAFVAALMHGWSERGSVRIPTDVSIDSGKTNVVIIILDATRRDVIDPGFDGVSAAPGLVSWAATRGGVRSMVAPSPSTLPSTASLFTGLLSSRHGAHRPDRGDAAAPEFGYPLSLDAVCLAERFAENGYVTAAVSGNYAVFDPRFGLDQGFEYYSADRNEAGRFIRKQLVDRCYPLRRIVENLGFPAYGYESATPYRNAEAIVDETLDVLRALDAHPFFLVVNIFDAHSPYIPPEYRSIRRQYPDTDWILQGEPLMAVEKAMIGDGAELSADRLALLRELYAAEVRYADRHLTRLLDALDPKTTWIAVISDHGEFMGEHSMLKHSTSLYRELLDVPLVISAPSSDPSLQVEGIADFTALHDAILRAGGIEPPQRNPVPGVVSETFSAQHPMYDTGKRVLCTENIASIERTPWKLIAGGTCGDQLFNLESDPGERVNRIDAEPEIVRALKSDMDKHMAEPGDAPVESHPVEEISEDLREELEVLGYLN